MNDPQILNYQDIKSLYTPLVLPPPSENCQVCNSLLKVRVENNGFNTPDPEHKETHVECPNDCLQDDNSVIL